MIMKRMTSTVEKDFGCKHCVETIKRILEPAKEISIYDQVEFVKSFCYLGNRLNASGRSEAAATARTRIGWLKFGECGKLLHGGKTLLKMK